MNVRLKYLFAFSGILFAGLLQSCEKELYRSIENLCGAYWCQPYDVEAPLMRFDLDGNVSYWPYRYESAEGIYYIWNDAEADGEYIIDAENSTLCLLPDEWYDIYVLSAGMLTLDDGHDINIKMMSIADGKVVIMTEEEFMSKSPAEP